MGANKFSSTKLFEWEFWIFRSVKSGVKNFNCNYFCQFYRNLLEECWKTAVAVEWEASKRKHRERPCFKIWTFFAWKNFTTAFQVKENYWLEFNCAKFWHDFGFFQITVTSIIFRRRNFTASWITWKRNNTNWHTSKRVHTNAINAVLVRRITSTTPAVTSWKRSGIFPKKSASSTMATR